MPDFNAWLVDSVALDASPRAVQAWNRIKDKPTAVTFKKPNGTTLAAQTIRLERDARIVREAASASGLAPQRALIVFGVQDHPDTAVIDTDMAEGYRFIYRSAEYRIVDVVSLPGELQATCEAVG